MVIKFLKRNLILTLILLSTFFLHFFRLDYPKAYVFDEVYHGFTAREYLKGSRDAWDWLSTPPPGVAYEWTHPPLAKELMTASMFLTSTTDEWGWRLPRALLGVISVFLVYKLGEKIFNKNTGLVSAFIFSLDGLNFVQSRTGMNDIYLVTFSLASLLLLLNKKFFFSAVFVGLAFASKWSGAYLVILNSLLLLYFLMNKKIRFKQFFRALIFIGVLVPIIYLFAYLPFFQLGFSQGDFVELQRQIWWYHSHLKATHDYTSPAWSWPLNLYPVWYFVEYHQNGLVSNIFASGNPILFWLGVGAILITIYEFISSLRKKSNHETNLEVHHQKNQLVLNYRDKYFIILLGFFVFWLPWLFSPRIMFLYHFSPSVPFLCLALGYQINLILSSKGSRWLGIIILILIALGFFLVYPVLTGIPLPKDIFVRFFDFNLAKNPFGG